MAVFMEYEGIEGNVTAEGYKTMKKHKNQQFENLEVVPKRVADIPQREREAMQSARRKELFDGQAHLANSPVGRAVANGFPLAVR